MSIEDVRTLVAERQRYDDWLAALEARRADTPSRVFERVYGDYVGRRSGVLDQLREHVEALTTLGRDLETRINALEEQLAGHEDERAEAILRTAVGEYDGDRWETVRQDVESKIGTLSEQHGALLVEVDDVRTLLASARPEPEPEPEPVAPPIVTAELDDPEPLTLLPMTAPPSVGADLEPALVDLTPVEPMLATVEPARDLRSVASLTPPYVPAHQGAVVIPSSVPASGPYRVYSGETAPTPVASNVALPAELSARAMPSASSPSAPMSAEEQDGADFDDALALFSTEPHVPSAERESNRPRGFEPDSSGASDALFREQGAPSAGSGARQAIGIAPQPASPDASPAPARDAFDDLAFLRSVIDPAAQNAGTRAASATDQQKTLRCTECGTMNFPTEWYCERCGGELAAF